MDIPDEEINSLAIIADQYIGKYIQKECAWKIKQKTGNDPIQRNRNPFYLCLLFALFPEIKYGQDHKQKRFDGMSISIKNIGILKKQIIEDAAKRKDHNKNRKEFFYTCIFNNLLKEQRKKDTLHCSI